MAPPRRTAKAAAAAASSAAARRRRAPRGRRRARRRRACAKFGAERPQLERRARDEAPPPPRRPRQQPREQMVREHTRVVLGERRVVHRRLPLLAQRAARGHRRAQHQCACSPAAAAVPLGASASAADTTVRASHRPAASLSPARVRLPASGRRGSRRKHAAAADGAGGAAAACASHSTASCPARRRHAGRRAIPKFPARTPRGTDAAPTTSTSAASALPHLILHFDVNETI